MSPTHTIHDFVLSHRSKPIMVLLVLPTNKTQSTKNLNVSNQIDLIEIFEVMRMKLIY
jgi:hypothetical protein